MADDAAPVRGGRPARRRPTRSPASAAAYATEVAELLFTLLVDVVRMRAPDVEPVVRGDASPASDLPIDRCVRALQAQGIWFQLLSIAEQNAAMRRRRQIEMERGLEGVQGHLRQRVRRARVAAGTPPEAIAALLRPPARPSRHHGASHRGQAGDGAREAPPHLPPAGGPRSRRAGRRASARVAGGPAPRRDRPAVDDRRAPPREADGAAGGVLGPALLQRDAVRGRARDCWTGSSVRWRSSIPGEPFTVSALLPVRLLGGRRPRRQSVRHQRRDPQHAQREPGRVAPPLPAAARRNWCGA